MEPVAQTFGLSSSSLSRRFKRASAKKLAEFCDRDLSTWDVVGIFLDGKTFDSSYDRGQPISFPLNGVIKCWTEGVQRMKVGGKAKLVCPSSIAYGERGAGNTIPPNATLVFEIELLAIGGR